jgi:hypothetical protein
VPAAVQGENVGELRVRMTPHLKPTPPPFTDIPEEGEDDLDDDLLDIDSIDKLKGKETYVTVRLTWSLPWHDLRPVRVDAA